MTLKTPLVSPRTPPSSIGPLALVSRRRVLPAALLCCAVSLASLPLRADNIYAGPGCANTTLGQALDEANAHAGPDEIRLLQGTFQESISLTNPDLVISGGWTGCGSATRSGRTVVRTSSGATTIHAGGGALLLRHLDVRSTAAAITTYNTFVVLEDTLVQQSHTGLLLLAESQAILEEDSVILLNDHGVVCERRGWSAGGPTLVVRGTITANSTSADGGGIWAYYGCHVEVEDGAAITSNTAAGTGGGIYVQELFGEGASLTITGGPIGIDLSSNDAYAGGGLAVEGASSATLAGLSIAHNEATLGGGIFVGEGSVGLGDGVTLLDNTAHSSGGGLYADTSATVTMGAGVTILDNEARWGGGINLGSGADLDAVADGPPIWIVGNTAEYGGGIYLAHTGTEALFLNTLAYDNEAFYSGGGILVDGPAHVQFERGNFISCTSAPWCSQLSGNRVLSPGTGAALHVLGGGSALIAQGFVEANSGPLGQQTAAIAVEGAGSLVTLEGIQFWNNDVLDLMLAESGGQILARFVSAARNHWSFGGDVPLDVVAARSIGGGILITSSVFDDTRGFGNDGATGDCLIVDDDTNLTPGRAGTILVGVDPGFVSPDDANLHLRAGSPAVDFCDDLFAPNDSDFDLHVRGQQIAAAPDGLGPYDLGADEFVDAGAYIFVDGFESGDTSRW